MNAESELAKAASGFVGQRIERLEDDARLLGRGSCADDPADRARHVGEPVAVLVAEDRHAAEDALEPIRMEHEALPAVVAIEQALDAGSIALHEAVDSNAVSGRSFRYGDPEAAFAPAGGHAPSVRAVPEVAHA